MENSIKEGFGSTLLTSPHANDALERISINPGLEAEFKFLNDGLVIKPKTEVSINFDNEKPTYKYKSISAKATLNVDYRW